MILEVPSDSTILHKLPGVDAYCLCQGGVGQVIRVFQHVLCSTLDPAQTACALGWTVESYSTKVLHRLQVAMEWIYLGWES